MLMTTQERIDYLSKPGRVINIRSLYDNCESDCFKIVPCFILFQQFVPGDVYNVTLTIRNVTNVNIASILVITQLRDYLCLSMIRSICVKNFYIIDIATFEDLS